MTDQPLKGTDLSLSVPRRFFEKDLPQIKDVVELKVLLTVFRLASDEHGYDGMVAEDTLRHEHGLVDALRLLGSTLAVDDDIRRGIELSVARGALLRFVVSQGSREEAWLLPASDSNRMRLARIQRGEIAPPHLSNVSDDQQPLRVHVERPNVFQLYEQNIGMVTPIIADQLVEAIELYPEPWIEEAITEAVGYNRRQWRYIQRILERWATEGRGHETNPRFERDTAASNAEKYTRGKYASLFRRQR